MKTLEGSIHNQQTYQRLVHYLSTNEVPTPCLLIDVQTVRERFAALRSALPDAEIFYAVKANPQPEVVRVLVELGASFDVASPGEIQLCLEQGATPDRISYGNTLKKRSDIAFAHEAGVRLFATDSTVDVANIAELAPGASVFCRLLVSSTSATQPFGRKFGCSGDMAVDVLTTAKRLGLDPVGLSFHVGSQHLSPEAWQEQIEESARVAAKLAAEDIPLRLLNLGGGFPASYQEKSPEIGMFGTAIGRCLDTHFGQAMPRLLIEPGRALVAEAGLLRTEVVNVSRRTYEDDVRWVYLDAGRYNGFAECEGEGIRYELRTEHDGKPVGPVVLAGPTCDGDDVMYQKHPYQLPVDLAAGDRVDVLGFGAYSTSFASVFFNGFAPLTALCIDDPGRAC
ncbi:type III PLP-dependent enzyme [Pseudonocardiaceae bacterium YIM PH 21723]|nr:type III PLP-dependent enzyme [Pseudonocardiaceae bacterium YIM PH 21723]